MFLHQTSPAQRTESTRCIRNSRKKRPTLFNPPPSPRPILTAVRLSGETYSSQHAVGVLSAAYLVFYPLAQAGDRSFSPLCRRSIIDRRYTMTGRKNDLFLISLLTVARTWHQPVLSLPLHGSGPSSAADATESGSYEIILAFVFLVSTNEIYKLAWIFVCFIVNRGCFFCCFKLFIEYWIKRNPIINVISRFFLSRS